MPDESKRRHHYEGGSAPWIVVSGEDGLDRIERGRFEAVRVPFSVLSPCEEPHVEPPFFCERRLHRVPDSEAGISGSVSSNRQWQKVREPPAFCGAY